MDVSQETGAGTTTIEAGKHRFGQRVDVGTRDLPSG
jgi:hypothetical protein